MSDEKLIIPANIVLDIRGSAISLMGGPTEDLDEAMSKPGRELHPEWFAGGRARLEFIWSFLDFIGWGGEAEDSDIEVSLAKYGFLLGEAVNDNLVSYETWEEEADASDRWRAENGMPPRKEEILRRGAALREFEAVLESLLPAAE